MTVHALAGLPRSGSTLLANLLAQHPDVHVSGTSALPQVLAGVKVTLSTDPAVRSDLIAVPGTYDRLIGVYRSIIEAWYADRDEACIVDKGRGWLHHAPLLTQVDADARIVACVRDPRDVFASVLAQDQATAAFASELGPRVHDQGLAAFGDGGLIGGPLRAVEDAVRRGAEVTWIRYESFMVDPRGTLRDVTALFGLEAWDYDFDDVQNRATDVDALYLNKFPHEGSGPVKASTVTWREILHPEVAANCVSGFPLFMQTFSYGD